MCMSFFTSITRVSTTNETTTTTASHGADFSAHHGEDSQGNYSVSTTNETTTTTSHGADFSVHHAGEDSPGNYSYSSGYSSSTTTTKGHSANQTMGANSEQHQAEASSAQHNDITGFNLTWVTIGSSRTV